MFFSRLALLVLFAMVASMVSSSNVYLPRQVIYPPTELGSDAVLWGIGLAATPNHDFVLIVGFNNITTNVQAQVFRLNSSELYEPYGSLMVGHPVPELHDPGSVQTDPASAFISIGGSIILWGFNNVDGSGDPYGYLYTYYHNGSDYHFQGELANPNSTRRLWPADVSGLADGSLIVVSAPTYPFVNTTFTSILVVYELESTAPFTYTIIKTIEHSDPSLTLWGWSNVISADGRFIVVGAYANRYDGNRVYVYDTTNDYSLVTVIRNPVVNISDSFGYSVAIAEDTYRIGIGAFRYNAGSFAGRTFTYDYNATAGNWSSTPVIHDWANKTAPTTGQGASVSFDKTGNLFANGMPYGADANGEIGVYRYYPENSSWVDYDFVTAFEIVPSPGEPINIGWPSTVHSLISNDGCHLFGPGPGNIPIDTGYVFTYSDPACVPFPPIEPPTEPPIEPPVSAPSSAPVSAPVENPVESPVESPVSSPSFMPETTTPQQNMDGVITSSVIGGVFGLVLFSSFIAFCIAKSRYVSL